MPYLETVNELAERLADLLHIYNQGIRFVDMTREASRMQDDWSVSHADDCQCRRCWTGAMERRIRAAVAHEALLARAAICDED